jgi:hypothetical protein
MNSLFSLLNRVNPLEIGDMIIEEQTISSACRRLGISVDDNVETELLSPGIRLFHGFDRHQKRMIRYKAIELGDRLIIETY